MSNPVRVFIVDDSTVYRGQIRAALEGQPGVEVVGFATNGRMACDALKVRQVDVLTLDMEMPEMNGVDVIRELKSRGAHPKIIVLSSASQSGADQTMTALGLGASDFIAKPVLQPGGAKTPAELIRDVLLPKVKQFSAPDRGPRPTLAPTLPSPKAGAFAQVKWASFQPRVVVIASSTGGPGALERLFARLRPPLSVPILIAQHMPPVFTASLADRLSRLSGLPVAEAADGRPLEKGHVYIAPGDYHLRLAQTSAGIITRLDQAPQRNSVRPAADFLLESAASLFANGCLGAVLTGMGADGKDGAVAIKTAGGAVFIQDPQSSVVFGMPGAVFAEGAFDEMGPVERFAQVLKDLAVCTLEEK